MSYHPTFLPWCYTSSFYGQSLQAPSLSSPGLPLLTTEEIRLPDPHALARPKFNQHRQHRPIPQPQPQPYPHPRPHSLLLTDSSRSDPYQCHHCIAQKEDQIEGRHVSTLDRVHQIQQAISAFQARLDPIINTLEDRISRLEARRKEAEEESLARGQQALQSVLADLVSQGIGIDPSFTPPMPNPEMGLIETNNGQNSISANQPVGTVDPKAVRFGRMDTPSEEDSMSSAVDPMEPSFSGIDDADHEPSQASQLLLTVEDPMQMPSNSLVGDSSSTTAEPSPSIEIGGNASPVDSIPAGTPDANTSENTILRPCSTYTRQLRPRNKTMPVTTSKPGPAMNPSKARNKTEHNPSKRPRPAAGCPSTSQKRKRIDTGEKAHLPRGVLARGSGTVRVRGAVWPSAGSNSVQGLGRDIQCESCEGRAHWTCAGFADNEVYGEAEWICPDCLYLTEQGKL